MRSDGADLSIMRVDGGMIANDWLAQQLADLVQIPVDRPKVIETTALGTAFLAGLQVGIFDSVDDIAQHWHLQRHFDIEMAAEASTGLYEGWQEAVQRVIS